MPKIIPSLPEVLREAVIVIAGALIATMIVKALPIEYKSLFNFTGNDK